MFENSYKCYNLMSIFWLSKFLQIMKKHFFFRNPKVYRANECRRVEKSPGIYTK